MSTVNKTENFLEQLIEKEISEGKLSSICTRFPPEPNGFLHIGHAKSICLNFGLARKFGGLCYLRFDDTNPEKEKQNYVDSIMEDVFWLGFRWDGEVSYASDYFDILYQWAQHLIQNNKAYVCDLSYEEAREYRGWATSPGKNSPFRERGAEENLDLFERMKKGEFENGEKVLRAKLDMSSPNMNFRDPTLYRIRHQSHHKTGDKWCIYPSYDFAHGQEDAIEGITHSICTLEFQDHAPLYDWFIDNLPVPHRPRQFEFARLHLKDAVTSKRELKKLIDAKVVDGWDDPRLHTISGMRRRGYPPGSIRDFCDIIGVTRSDSIVDIAMLEHTVRNELNQNAPRAMVVLDPLKLVITNFDECEMRQMKALVHPDNPDMGDRYLPFSSTLYIDRSDFREDSTLSKKKFKRLVLGEWVRLRNCYIIQANKVVYDDSGAIDFVECTLVAGTVGNSPKEGVRPRGVIHWLSAEHAKLAEIRLYDRLFLKNEEVGSPDNILDTVNPESLQVIQAYVEPDITSCKPEQAYQFEREGYFVADRFDHSAESPVFNRVIGLKDTKPAE